MTTGCAIEGERVKERDSGQGKISGKNQKKTNKKGGIKTEIKNTRMKETFAMYDCFFKPPSSIWDFFLNVHPASVEV